MQNLPIITCASGKLRGTMDFAAECQRAHIAATLSLRRTLCICLHARARQFRVCV